MSTSHTPHTTATGCADWLRAHLADGARSAADVRAAAAAAGYTWRTVQRAALALGVSAHTLRRWERAGLLTPEGRTLGGQRRYDLARLQLVRVEPTTKDT